jgi:hypothetical protein
MTRSAATTRCAAGASQRQVSTVPVQMWARVSPFKKPCACVLVRARAQTASTARSSASTAIRSALGTASKAACSRCSRGTLTALRAVLRGFSQGTLKGTPKGALSSTRRPPTARLRGGLVVLFPVDAVPRLGAVRQLLRKGGLTQKCPRVPLEYPAPGLAAEVPIAYPSEYSQSSPGL